MGRFARSWASPLGLVWACATGAETEAGRDGGPLRAGALGPLPLESVLNQGQTDARVRFTAHVPGYTLFLTPDEAVFAAANRSDGARATSGGVVVARPQNEASWTMRQPARSRRSTSRVRPLASGLSG